MATQGRMFTKQDHDRMVALTNNFNADVRGAVMTHTAQQLTSSESTRGTFGGEYTNGVRNYQTAGAKINGKIAEITDAVTKAGAQLHETGSTAGRSQAQEANNLAQPKLQRLGD
jgi:hypothetical protein